VYVKVGSARFFYCLFPEDAGGGGEKKAHLYLMVSLTIFFRKIK